MELIPHGIGLITLGMLPVQVENILGKHHTYEEWMGGNLNDSLLYRGMVISFNRSDASKPLENSQANEIWIHSNCPATLAGQDVFSLYKRDIEKILTTKEINFESSNDIWVSEYGWDFCFDENARVTDIYLLPV
jgi:hypothetical protein